MNISSTENGTFLFWTPIMQSKEKKSGSDRIVNRDARIPTQ